MNVNCWFEEDLTKPKSLPFCGGKAVVYTCRSPNKPTVNEDAAAIVEISPQHGILIVADGVGGHSVGSRASRAAVNALLSAVKGAATDESLRTRIVDSLESANREILSWGVGAATTVVIAEYLDGQVRTFHAGDSTAMICSSHGNLKFNTIAHAPVAMAVEIGMMNEQQALIHEDRNLISNCLGIDPMKIDLGTPMAFASRDTLLLASDGLFDNLTVQETIDLVRAGDLGKSLNCLLAATQARMANPLQLPSKPDDLTFICFRQ